MLGLELSGVDDDALRQVAPAVELYLFGTFISDQGRPIPWHGETDQDSSAQHRHVHCHGCGRGKLKGAGLVNA